MLSARGLVYTAVSLLLLGCASGTPRPAPSTPEPSPSVLPAPVSQRNAWSFAYKAGVNSYDVRRSATVASIDSSTRHEVTTNLTHEILSLERIGDTIQFSLAADTFATTTQGLLGPTQSVVLPVRISGSLAENRLQINDDSVAGSCNVAESALRSDLQNLIVPIPLPQPLTRGMAWRDSLEEKSCQAMIPTTAHVDRSFTVVGEVIYNGAPAIAVERRDTIRAHGEGAQKQHQITIDVTGSGSALHYLSASTGRIIGVSANQHLDLAISTSGRTHRFTQDLKQEFAIAP